MLTMAVLMGFNSELSTVQVLAALSEYREWLC